MSVRKLLAVAVALVVTGTACSQPKDVRCVVSVYRPDGTLHREYHGTFRSFDGGLPPIHNARSGAAWVYLDGRTIDAAAGWQIEVDREAEATR